MKQLIRLWLGIISCLLLACDFSPSGSHFEDVNPNQQVVADITLTGQEDTIFVRGDINLHFKLFLPGREFYGHKLELGDQVLFNSGHEQGVYHFNSEKHSDGFHILKYTAYGRSNTGSLADVYRAEAIQVHRTWVVEIFNGEPQAPAVTNIKLVDGQVQITSAPYTGPLFKHMELVRKISDYPAHVLATTTDPNTTSWTDASYLGGPATYWLVVHLEQKKYSPGTAGSAASYHYPLPAILKASYEVENEVKVTFSSSPFKNFKSYLLSSDAGFFETYNRADTVVTFPDPGFGKDFTTSLITYLKESSDNYYAGWYESHQPIPGRGTAWGPYEGATILRSAASNRFYVLHEGILYLVDATTLQVLKQRDANYMSMEHGLPQLALSVDGRYTYLVLNNIIHRLHPATLQTLETFRPQDLAPSADYSSFGIDVSNDHRLMLALQNTATGRDAVYLIDMERRKLVTHIETGWSAYSALSPDGRAMRVGQTMYLEQGNGTWKEQPHETLDTYAYAFHPTMPMYAYKEGPTISFYSTVTGARQKIITADLDLFQYEIDAGSGHLFGYAERMARDRNLYVYDLSTGQRLRKLKLADNVIAFVYKNRIFSNQRYIKL